MTYTERFSTILLPAAALPSSAVLECCCERSWPASKKGDCVENILADFPTITAEDVRAVIAFNERAQK